MGIFDRIFRRNLPEREHHGGRPWMDGDEFAALLFKRGSFRSNHAMKLSAVYRCVNCISDSVAQLPLEIFRIDSKGFKKKDRRHELFRILNSKPNARMTRYTLISLLVQSMLLKGNGYAWIRRGAGGKVKDLVFLPAEYVTIIPPMTILEPVEYEVMGIRGRIKATDMIHVLNQTADGVVGVSTLEYARLTLGLSHDSERHAANFFSSGCAVGGILTTPKILDKKQKRDIKEGWRMAFGNDGESNGVAVLEGGLTYQPVTINARDSQLLETRQFNVIDVCRFFGVSPVKVFDLSKSSYSTVEATNIGFLTDTLSPLLEKIELEMETKLFPGEDIDVRFDVAQLLRADKQSLASYYSTMFQIGAIAPNEIRREIDLPAVEGGDKNFVQVNMQDLKNAGEIPDALPEPAQGDRKMIRLDKKI